MTGPLVTDWIQAGAALLTMGAALAALIVAFRAPQLAAKFAEDYRRRNASEDEIHRWRLGLLSNLMAYRSEILHPNARVAVNTVDVAFAGFPEVREARRLFIDATRTQPSNPTTIIERYHALIEAVARANGLANLITGFDVRAGYYPEAVGMLDSVALMEAEEKLAERSTRKGSDSNSPAGGKK